MKPPSPTETVEPKASLKPEFWPSVAREVKENPDLFVGICLVAAAAISLHWTATAFENVIDHFLEHGGLAVRPFFFGLLCTPLSIGLALGVWHHRHTFRELRNRVYVRSDRTPKKCLVFFLSTQPLLKAAHSLPSGVVRLPATKDCPEVELAGRDPLADAEQLVNAGVRWNWEMLLRGLHPHLGAPLERVWIIGSADAKDPATGKPIPGSFSFRDLCCQFLSRYLAHSDVARAWPQPVDFENVEKIEAALKQLIAGEAHEGRSPEDICIDITGGQKPTSVAGAIVTLNSAVTNQYVQTNGSKEAFIYDLVFVAPAQSLE